MISCSICFLETQGHVYSRCVTVKPKWAFVFLVVVAVAALCQSPGLKNDSERDYSHGSDWVEWPMALVWTIKASSSPIKGLEIQSQPFKSYGFHLRSFGWVSSKKIFFVVVALNLDLGTV